MPKNDSNTGVKEDPPSETSTPPGPAIKERPREGARVPTAPAAADEEVVPAPSDNPKGSAGQEIPGKPISDMDPPGQDEPEGPE
jgi:hypothetical protein